MHQIQICQLLFLPMQMPSPTPVDKGISVQEASCSTLNTLLSLPFHSLAQTLFPSPSQQLSFKPPWKKNEDGVLEETRKHLHDRKGQSCVEQGHGKPVPREEGKQEKRRGRDCLFPWPSWATLDPFIFSHSSSSTSLTFPMKSCAAKSLLSSGLHVGYF